MAKTTVASLEAKIEALETKIEALEAKFEELTAKIERQPRQMQRPSAKPVEGDSRGRTPGQFARDACYALRNVHNRQFWVQPSDGKFIVTKGFDKPVGPMSAAELMDLVRKERAAAQPTAA